MAKEGTFWIDEQEGMLVFNSEEGEDRFYIENELKLDGNKYLILIPADLEDEEAEEALVLKLISDGDEEILSVIEDDDEFEKVKNAYIAMYQD